MKFSILERDKTPGEIKELMHDLGLNPTWIMKRDYQYGEPKGTFYGFGVEGRYEERKGLLEKIFGPIFDAIEGERPNPLKKGPLPRHTYIDSIKETLADAGFEVYTDNVLDVNSGDFFKVRKSSS